MLRLSAKIGSDFLVNLYTWTIESLLQKNLLFEGIYIIELLQNQEEVQRLKLIDAEFFYSTDETTLYFNTAISNLQDHVCIPLNFFVIEEVKSSDRLYEDMNSLVRL